MADSKVVSLRVPDELLKAVDDLAGIKYPPRTTKDKPNRSQIILDAIQAYIDTSSDNVNNTDDSVNNAGLTEERVISLITTATSSIKESIEELTKKANSLAAENQALREQLGKFTTLDSVSNYNVNTVKQYQGVAAVEVEEPAIAPIPDNSPSPNDNTDLTPEPAPSSPAEDTPAVKEVEEVEETAPIDEAEKTDAGEISVTEPEQNEDNLRTVELGEVDAIAVDPRLKFIDGITGTALGERIGKNSSNLTKWKKVSSDLLAERSKKYDPDGIAWKYIEKEELYYPIIES